ncbi:D-glycerate dehydrogenase [Bordetella sp. FB-8]|uniref:2-hydroxyacid dehydrogenase n=1 Tax=Bordetella sp. FB-8 TaxID=1159870 RepID=UPI000379AAA5|nr:D-glycerate dehydrogenase [Bordetella sp. FB-8]
MTTRPRVIVSVPVPEDLRAELAGRFDIVDVPVGERPAEVLSAQVRADIQGQLITPRTRVDDDLMQSLPRLRVSSNFAVGYDNVDLPAANRRKVLICNTPNVLNNAVADVTLGLMLCLARNLVAGDAFVRSGAWTRGPFPLTHDIRGKTFGLLGMGRIGRVVARGAQAFDMKVIYHNRRLDEETEALGLASYVDRDTLFRDADVLCVLVPLTAETRHSVGAREFAMMKPTAYLINTARGAVLDEAALIEALRSGKIAGAGLDVMETEPLPADSPLCSLPNVVLQAHVGSATHETRRAMMELAVHNLIDALSGIRPTAMVNPELWG